MDPRMFDPWLLAPVVMAFAAAIHAVRTGRPGYWVWIVLFFPFAGPLIYFLAEVVPSSRYRAVGVPGPSLLDRLIAGRELARLTDALDRSLTVANRQALAAYHVRQENWPEAQRLLQDCLTGVYKDDPGLKLMLAEVHFHAGDLKDAQLLLEAARAEAPRHDPQAREFLLGRIAEERGDTASAIAIYDAMRAAGPITEEARVRLAMLHEAAGHPDRARELYTDVVRRMKTASHAYRREQREWLKVAKTKLKQVAS